MSFESRVYRVLIASPSDVDDEREIAVRVIQEWNDLHSFNRKVVLLPLRWETHTAPEYGTRPQSVINKAIVDQCDLLVGIFWTRIGSPTGVAESGTLEEIDRVASAGKPAMLYFSKVGVDPATLDLSQIEKLNEFKDKSYSNSLNESYKSVVDFRDKFARQLELKVRDLQKDENDGTPSLSIRLNTLDSDAVVPVEDQITTTVPSVTGLSDYVSDMDDEDRDNVDKTVEYFVRKNSAIPVVLSIDNQSSQGIRNVFIEVTIESNNGGCEVADVISRPYLVRRKKKSSRAVQFFPSASDLMFYSGGGTSSDLDDLFSNIEDEESLHQEEGVWRFSFEWGAMQPQRRRFIKPPLYLIPSKSTKVKFTAKLYADSFAQPAELSLTTDIKVKKEKIDATEAVSDMESLFESRWVVS